MNSTITKFSSRFKLGRTAALLGGASLLGVVAFFALPYLVPISDPALRPTVGAAFGLIVGCLIAIFGGSLIKKN